MKLKHCYQGAIVISDSGNIGMIIGITNNAPSADIIIRSEHSRVNILVQWSNGNTSGVHPANIEIYKGDL